MTLPDSRDLEKAKEYADEDDCGEKPIQSPDSARDSLEFCSDVPNRFCEDKQRQLEQQFSVLIVIDPVATHQSHRTASQAFVKIFLRRSYSSVFPSSSAFDIWLSVIVYAR